MYNQEVKTDYMQQLEEDKRKIIDRIFRFSEELENKKGKDLCDFNEQDFLELFKSYASSSLDSLNTYSSFARGYVQWACDNNINKDNINHLDYISSSQLRDCVNQYAYQGKYITYNGLMEIVKKIENPCDKSLVLALFFGIHGKDCREFYNIILDDIDKENEKVALISGRTVYIPLEVCEIFINSCKSYEYISTNPNSRIKAFSLDPLDKRIFKRRINSRSELTNEKENLRIAKRLCKLREEFNCPALSIPRLINAGMLHFMKLAIENNKATKENIYISKAMEEIKEQYYCIDDCYGLKAKFNDYIKDI